jgi:hypothetical protein
MARTINDLREIIFQTMEDLKAGRIDVDHAKQIANLGQVIVNSAVAETKFIKEQGGSGTDFISKVETVKQLEQKKMERVKDDVLSTQEKTLRKYGV